MERLEIIKEFCKYCKDLNLEINTKNKNKFVKDYMNNYTQKNGIKDFEIMQKQIKDILKYNNLTIYKIYINL